jgi:hypothetical protein
MTADLTPLLERQKELRRQRLWTTISIFISGATALLVWHHLTWFSALMALLMCVASWGAQQSFKRQMERLELDQTTASLATQRALLRRSAERRDAEAGLSMSDEAGGELAAGQDGELSEDP